LGVDGTRDGRRARARFFHGNADVPTIVEGAGSSDAVGGLLAELASLVPEAPVMIEDVQICKRDGRVVAGPTELADTDPSGRPIWQKLTVHTSESTTHGGRAVHRELLDRLLAGDAAGATCIRGIWGFHDERAPHGDRLLQLRRRVPVVTTVIDRPSRIARSFEIVDGLTRESGLVTSQLVPALVAIGSDERIGGLELADLPGRPAG
jgi:PII-like signaling protein